MNVELIEYTGRGRADQEWHAADLLIFTKATRLNMTGELLQAVAAMTPEEKLAELAYMAGTIPSSWEFVDLTFLVSGVTRATAQQMTRTRTASFAMQSLRVADASDAEVTNPFPPNTNNHAYFDLNVGLALGAYRDMIDEGAAKQDARGILPLNTQCNIVCKYNLRSFVELMRARSSLRAQGEYTDIADQMKRLVIEAWPWSEVFFESPHDKAISMLEGVATELGLEVGSGPAWQIAKAIDLIKKG